MLRTADHHFVEPFEADDDLDSPWHEQPAEPVSILHDMINLTWGRPHTRETSCEA